MRSHQSASMKPGTVKFRMPSAENLLPIRLDIEIEGQRLKDAFTWNLAGRDSEIPPFARLMVKDLSLPPAFIQQIVHAIQSQIAEYRSYEELEMSTEEKVQILKDVTNCDSDPEGFARGLCRDLEITDPEVGPAIAVSIREQLYEIAKQNITSGRETRISKKSRRERGIDFSQTSTPGTTALNLMRRPNSKISILRRKNEWDLFEPAVEILTNKEVEALDARDERNARLKKRGDDKEDMFPNRFLRA